MGVHVDFGEYHPDVAIYRSNLGGAWKLKGQYDKATGYYELALASGLKTFGEDHPDVATYRNNLGIAWESKGQYDKAIGYYESALDSFAKKLGSSHPNTKVVADNLVRAKAKLVKETNRKL